LSSANQLYFRLFYQQSGGENLKKLKAFQARHKLASDIGGGIGTVGSIFIPGGAVAKGAGLGLKALGAAKTADKVLDAAKFLKGTGATGGLVEGAARGAGQALEQGLVRTATGNQDAEDLIPSVLLGGGAGAIGGKIASKLKAGGALKKGAQELDEAGNPIGNSAGTYVIDEAKEALNKATLKSVGIETRALRQAMNGYGMKTALSKVNKGEDYVADVAATIRSKGITGKRGFEQFMDQNKNTWQNIDKGFEKNAPKDWGKIAAAQLKADPELIEKALESGEKSAQDLLDNITAKIAGETNFSIVRNTLRNIAKNNVLSNMPADQAKAQMANALLQKFDDFVADNSGLGADVLKTAKHDYKILQPWINQEARDVVALNKTFSPGSSTFEKNLLSGGIGGLGLGGGSVGMDVIQGNDVDYGRAVGLGITGSLLGPNASRLLSKAANKGVSVLGRATATALESPLNSTKATQFIDNAVAAAGNNAGKVGGDIGAALPSTPEQAQLEAAIPQEAVKEVRAQAFQELAPQMKAQLQEIYSKYYYNVDPQQFMDAVNEKTQGFSDIGAVFDMLSLGDQQKRQLMQRQYEDALAAKDLDIYNDDGKAGIALTAMPEGNSIQGTLAAILDEKGSKQAKDLREIMINKLTDYDLTKRTPAIEKKVSDTINMVRAQPELLDQMVEGYGLSNNEMRLLGVI